jgi:NAD(P)-dependent dehydrogenase (short-subunit alcohol dehydrogenase family)
MDMKVYAGRLAEEGIKVNGIEAGVIDTDLSRIRIPDYEEASEKGYVFMFRPGKPEDIAYAAIAAMKIYDTGRLIPAAGGTMTHLLNLRMMSELEINRSQD